MAKKLEGNGLFESSRMMLPEHREAYNRQFVTKNPRPRPVIDEQEWQQIGEALRESFEEHARVDIQLYDPHEEKGLSGFVTVINMYLQEIKLRSGDDWDWIKFEDIISAHT
ncbi:YolD-like family protein [Paenibacillus dokdonensis]|uniref:YolD-like family protein n=1 Tax=Paenibacillus dokdonensis TaxID=2567944 RepID=A0ABU6GUX3_9BACL|nr:YolD-like family protein [Paenibacillus dokdonensis]MEC0241957.1 YolD-like family protein [Paenibacillus dokdonensis]